MEVYKAKIINSPNIINKPNCLYQVLLGVNGLMQEFS